jgi:MFS family permease
MMLGSKKDHSPFMIFLASKSSDVALRMYFLGRGFAAVSLFHGRVLHNRTVLAISFAVFAVYTGLGMVNTVRVLYVQSHGASLTLISTMTSIYLVAIILFQYPISWSADHWGRKPVIVVSLLMQAAISALYVVVTNPVGFVLLRFLEGVAAAGVLPAARALIADTVPIEQRGEAYGLFTAFFNTGFLIGPGIGGLLATFNYAAVFLAAVFMRLIAATLVILLIPFVPPKIEVRPSIAPIISYKRLFVLPLLGAYLIAAGNYVYAGFENTLMPLWMHDHLGASIAIIGLAYTAWALPTMFLSPLGGRLADQKQRSMLILLFGLAQVPLYFTYGFANSAFLVVVLYAIHGTLYAFLQPALDTHIASASESSLRARIQGIYATSTSIGSLVGASALTPLYALNFRLPLFTIGAGYGCCLLIGYTLIHLSERRNKRSDIL